MELTGMADVFALVELHSYALRHLFFSDLWVKIDFLHLSMNRQSRSS